MRDTILLVGHGSRNPRGNDEIESFAQGWRKSRPNDRIELCSLEFSDVTLDLGLSHAATGSRRVIVIPLMLGAAGHVKLEIPHHVEQARKRHPNIEFLITKHLGAGCHILKALKSKTSQAMSALDAPDKQNTGMILLARGSSDKIANGEIAKMARWLFEENSLEMVDVAFTSITYPTLETVVQRQVACGMKQIIVLPYYLFAGVLIERITHQVEYLTQQYPTTLFSLATYIGLSPVIYELLDERVAETIHNNLKDPKALAYNDYQHPDFAEEHHLPTCTTTSLQHETR